MLRAMNDAALPAIADWLRAKTGLSFPESRRHDLGSALDHALARSGAADIDQLIRKLEQDPRLLDDILAEVTVTETYFFREPAQFEVLRREVVPELRRRLWGGGTLRVWSAGCASGEEPYSLAILLEQEGLAGQASILGTDINRSALARAAEARYSTWSLRGKPAASDCFERQGEHFLLYDRIRRRVAFKRLNLASDEYPSAATGVQEMDLILCRNVLIYFDRETIGQVARRLFATLRKGGWLVTGPSDPPLWDHAPLQAVMTAGGVFYRRDEACQPEPEPISFASANVPLPVSGNTRGTEIPLLPTEVRVGAAAAEREELRPDDSVVERGIHIARIRVLADSGRAAEAQTLAEVAMESDPLCPELRYLHAVVLLELSQHAAAAESLRRAIYLDPSLAVAHFLLGNVLMHLRALPEARRAFRNALSLSLSCPGGEILPLSDTEPAGALAEAARHRLALLETEAWQT
jgi:chemotaxis protein methyltransferase CheR